MSNQYRSPVVVVLGHVDHGKTTLLDYIRKSRKAEKEIGGITQHIGAYEVSVDKKDYHTDRITFIDTPGHEAFSKLRVQGANVADIAILVIDAVDSLMPQTKESIYHIKNAGLPFIVAVNKTDLPGANVDRVKKDLLKENVQVEGLGGEVPVVPISAKTGTGIADLLDMILFMASMKDFQYNSENPVKAYIIESKKEKAGIMATVIIKDGTLSVGDTVYAGMEEAKIKAMFSDSGSNLTTVIPSTPFLLLGFKELPNVGSELSSMPVKPIEENIIDIVDKRTQDEKNKALFVTDTSNKKLKLIIKTDSQGSLEAISSSLSKNENVEVVLAGLGEISKSDIFLAKVSKAIVIGFSISPDKNMLQLAKEEKVIIKTYNIIYELLEELTEVSDLLNEKQDKEKSLKGEAKILATFMIEQEQIAGVKVTKGKISIEDRVELFRQDRLVAESKIVSLRERAKTVREVKKNDEGGVLFYPKLDFAVGDVIKSYSI